MTTVLPWESGTQAGVSAPLADELSPCIFICKMRVLLPAPGDSQWHTYGQAHSPGTLGWRQDACLSLKLPPPK